MILQETYTLANGIAIPKLGLGTWFIDNNKAAQAVRDAVALGYRLIDTAAAYGNEKAVGRAIRRSTAQLRTLKLDDADKATAKRKLDTCLANLDELRRTVEALKNSLD